MNSGGYTAVLSIHGIGRHNAHRNAGALLEALEGEARRETGERIFLAASQTVLEPHRVDSSQPDVASIEVTQLRRGRRFRISRVRRARVYEVNWSPETRAAIPIWEMVAWLFRLLVRDWLPGKRNWLRFPRLRRARLHAGLADIKSAGERHARAILASSYRSFRGTAGLSFRDENDISTSATFQQFVDFTIERSNQAYPPERLLEVAQQWRTTKLPAERSIGRIRRIAISALLTIASLLATDILLILRYPIGSVSLWYWAILALPTSLIFAILFVLRYVMSRIISDVRYWSAISENEHYSGVRRAILTKTVGTIRHILEDPLCERLVIVSHSLGTTIAYDAMCEIARYNRARADLPEEVLIPIGKVKDFVTLGSPIDKVACLFEPDGGRNFREAELNEDIRGNLSQPPFFVGGKTAIRWTNFWDAADPISDPLFTPLGSKASGADFMSAPIRNIEVVNTSMYDPLGSHVKYFDNPKIARLLFSCTFHSEGGLTYPKASIFDKRRNQRSWTRLYMKSFQTFAPLMFFSVIPALKWPTMIIFPEIASVLAVLFGVGALVIALQGTVQRVRDRLSALREERTLAKN